MPTELEIINYETMQVKVYSKLCKHLLQYKTKPHCHVKKKKKKNISTQNSSDTSACQIGIAVLDLISFYLIMEMWRFRHHHILPK